jgi:hypothetical protein
MTPFASVSTPRLATTRPFSEASIFQHEGVPRYLPRERYVDLNVSPGGELGNSNCRHRPISKGEFAFANKRKIDVGLSFFSATAEAAR